MTQKYLNTTGIILAGGESSRMGVNKALLPIDGRTSIQIIFEKLKKLFENVWISSNDPINYSTLDAQIIADVVTDHGPLSGVHAGLASSSTEKVFFIPCDLPLMSIKMIRYFIELNAEEGIVLPCIQNIPRYDFGIYSRSLLFAIEKQLREEDTNPSLRKLINTGNTLFVEVEKLPFYDKNLFLNMNTPADYEHVKRLYKGRSTDNE